jgi:predicted enzyme related to lactoylglutathione lyase/catechol 2,3-dioxygenase-like lactoylglutathione lyase family enzyme
MARRRLTARLSALSVDANDPRRLARFWAYALQWEIGDETNEEMGLVPTDDTTFRIVFRRVSEIKAARNRIHLDLTTTSVEDRDESVSRLVELGARHIDIGQGRDEPHVVLADPEGNEFCVIEPENSFLAGCGRLGAVSCDGSREVGYFWSNVLGWPLVWDQDEETAIRAPDGTGPFITWGGGPQVQKVGKNRVHLEIAPPDHGDQHAEVDRLASLGATLLDRDEGHDSWVVMSDPDGNEFFVLHPR